MLAEKSGQPPLADEQESLTAPPSRESSWRSTLRVPLRDVRTYAALASLALSAWCVFIGNVLNNDSVLYLRSAELLTRGEWHAAVLLYKWPFYSILIALVHQLTGFSFEYAAHALNAVLTALTVVMFVSLVREVGGDSKVVVFAAAVILLHHSLNEYRSYALRDAGYLAFYLTSLLMFIKDLKEPKWNRTLAWVGAMVVAMLFRIEGIVFLVALPFFRLWQQATRLSARFALIGLFVGGAFIAISALAWWLLGSIAMPGPGGIMGTWAALLQTFWHNVSARAGAKIDLIVGAFGDGYSRDFAYAAFAAALLLIIVREVLASLTPLYAVLTGHAVYRRLIFPVPGTMALWYWLIAVHLVILATVLFVVTFLTGRSPLALSLTLMLAVPFSVASLYDAWRRRETGRRKSSWLFPLVCVLALLSTLGVLVSPTSKGHIRQAGLWLRDHTSPSTTVFSNDPVLLYYTGRIGNERPARYSWDDTVALVESDARSRYDYLALRLRERHAVDEGLLIRTIGSEPIMRFTNNDGDQVLIFRLH
jgi:hypothetical protein